MQLSLPLKIDVEYGEDNFIISSCNYEAYRAVKANTWHNGRMLIIGAKGSGKRHLSKIWANYQDAQIVDITYKFDTVSNLVLHNINEIEDEEFIFHLINHCQNYGTKLLMTAREFPAYHLQDLKSRINATSCCAIKWPDTDLMKYIILKQFSDRQLEIPFSVIEYAVKFLPRDFTAVQKFIDAIDAESMSQKRDITKPLVKEYFSQDERIGA